MKILLLCLLTISYTATSFAQVNISERIQIYEKYRSLARKFLFQFPDTVQKKLYNRINEIDQNSLKRLDSIIPAPFINTIAYHIFLEPDQERLEDTLNFLMVSRFLVLKQIVEDRQLEPQKTELAHELLLKWSGLTILNETSTEFMFELIQRRASLISRVGSAQAIIEAIEDTPLLTDNLKEILDLKRVLLAEPLGTIPGNQISVFMKNDRSLARAQALSELAFVQPTDSRRMEFANSMRQDSILRSFFELIQNARENLILVTPKTDGVSEDLLIKALTEKMAQSPLLKVSLISLGQATPRLAALNHQFEDRFALVSLPESATREGPLSWQAFLPIPDSINSDAHGLGLILVTDSGTESPKTYITSRRFIDHPHAYSHEQAMTIIGPAAGLMAKLIHSNLNQLAPRLSDVSAYFPTRDIYPHQGQEQVRISIDSARLGARDDRSMAVKFLLDAKEEILLDVHMLYDRAIVDTLIKQKIKNPDLNVKILLDTNLSTGLNGLPNAIFLAELKRYGIEVKARRSLAWEIVDNNGASFQRYGINHRNLMIRDQQHLFMSTGPFTGSFERRSPLSVGVIISGAMISELASNFERDWDNANTTYELDIENYQAQFEDRKLSTQVSSFLNDIFAVLLRAFD